MHGTRRGSNLLFRKGFIMHWFWWVLIIFVAFSIINKICEENHGFRQVLCCIIAVAYPILTLVFAEHSTLFLIFGALLLGIYKYVYGIAEYLEDEGPPDIFSFFKFFSDGELSVLAIIFSIVSAILFAAVAVVPVAFFTDVSMVLATIWLFVPAVYCIVTTVLYFRDSDY